MNFFVRLRRLFRRIPPLYWSVGVARYVHFQARLRSENKRHSAEGMGDVPPPQLRHRVHGALDLESYLNAGRVLGSSIVQEFETHGIGQRAAGILDFGCGPGRIAKVVKDLRPHWRLFGCDIDGEAVSWARSNLAGVAEFSASAQNPPLSYATEQFDALYSISVFTHLDEGAQFAWLAELQRVLRPGGLALITTHGVRTLASCEPLELEAIQRHGFAYRIDRTGALKLDGLPDSYQTAFHSRDYIERTWSRWFEILQFHEGGLAGHQDVVVLRRRA